MHCWNRTLKETVTLRDTKGNEKQTLAKIKREFGGNIQQALHSFNPKFLALVLCMPSTAK